MGAMMKTYALISAREAGSKESLIKGQIFTLMEDCGNDYHREELPIIPAGTEVIAEFAGDFGMYAMAEVDGVLHKIKIVLSELHKVNFGDFDARNFRAQPTQTNESAG